MLRMRHTIYLLIPIICFSCNDRPKNIDVVEETQTQNDAAVKPVSNDTLINSFPPPINIHKLKESLKSFTSGVLSTPDSKVFCNPENMKFFGFYFLLGHRGGGPFGTLTISLPQKPKTWVADDPQEEFEEIELNSNEAKVWDSVSVGMPEKAIIKFLGKNFHYKKGTTIYSELGNYSAAFTIQADTISKLKVGIYCTEKK